MEVKRIEMSPNLVFLPSLLFYAKPPWYDQGNNFRQKIFGYNLQLKYLIPNYLACLGKY